MLGVFPAFLAPVPDRFAICFLVPGKSNDVRRKNAFADNPENSSRTLTRDGKMCVRIVLAGGQVPSEVAWRRTLLPAIIGAGKCLMRRPIVWVFLLLLFLLTSSSALGQMTQGPLKKTLSGYIREEGTGHLVSEARIELQNSLGSPLASAYADRNGAYEFDDIGNTDFYISVQHQGYASSREFVRQEGAGHMYKDVFLHPLIPESGAKSVNPVSEHQLTIPQKARDTFEKGVQLVVQKSDYRGAVAQFERAISQYPDYYEAYAAMGLAQNKMGDARAAEISLLRSIEMSQEKYTQAMIDLGSMFNAQHRFSDGEPLLRKVVALDASSWSGQYQLAVALAGEKRFSDALPSASAARDLKPEEPQVYLLLYSLHVQTDNFSGAVADADAYLKLVPVGAVSDKVRNMREQILKNNPDAGKALATSPAKPNG
jgi:tetratricopeptide (TPR) repeat protein